MIKKILLSLASLLAIAVVLGFVFKEPLKEIVYREVAKDMFIEADDDSFEPGVSGSYVGDQFPAVSVMYSGAELSSLSQFEGTRGLIVMFSRSVLW